MWEFPLQGGGVLVRDTHNRDLRSLSQASKVPQWDSIRENYSIRGSFLSCHLFANGSVRRAGGHSKGLPHSPFCSVKVLQNPSKPARRGWGWGSPDHHVDEESEAQKKGRAGPWPTETAPRCTQASGRGSTAQAYTGSSSRQGPGV